MRWQLFLNPRLLCERLAVESVRRRRLAELKHTPAAGLSLGHIDSLELVKLARNVGVNVIYDIGANIGTWSLLVKSLIPGAVIHAFEPLAEHHVRFHGNLDHTAGVTLHPIALGPANATATMHVTDFSDASSLLRPNATSASEFGVSEIKRFELPVHRLDNYRRSESLPWPDLLKLDIQGYELEVLRGAPECIAAAKAVIAEVSFVEYYDKQCLFHELVEHLAASGLYVRAFGHGTVIGRLIGQTDVLFMRAAGAEQRP